MNSLNPPLVAAPAPSPSLSDATTDGGARPLFIQYLNMFKRRKWLILTTIAATLLLALLATLLMRPVYTATTRIEISRELKNVTNVAGVESEQLGRNLEFYQTQYSLLEAASLAERVMRRLRLDTAESFWESHGIDLATLDETAGSGPGARTSRDARQKAAIELLLTNVSISPIRGSALIDIGYSSYSPEMSAQIANSWSTEFVAQNIARKFDSTAEARSFLERRLTELRGKVEQSERDLVNYASQNNIISLSSESAPGSGQVRERTLAADSLEGLNQALINATAERIAAESRAASRGASSPSLVNPTLSALREQRAVAASEYAKLMVQFERGYPAARAVEQQIGELDRAISREESRVRNGFQQDYQAALNRENDLGAKVNALSGTLNEQRRDSIQYNIFQREADTNRQLYDGLLQRYKEIGVAGVSANNIALIDRAVPPTKPSSPNIALNLLLALVAGLIAALVLVFALEQSDEGLRDPTRVGELLGVPLLGSIPKAAVDVGVPEQIADPKSDMSEAYLAVRSSLGFTTDHGVPRSIMLVSSQPAEGKSTSSLGLATVLKRVGKRVILVDADLRNPSLHTTLGLTKQDGVTNYLAGQDDFHSLIRTLPNGLDFLSAGPSAPSAAELLSSDRMFQLIRLLERDYDHVVVDASPILGLADAPLLSRTVEAVVFVIQVGEVAVRGLRAALSRLRAADAPVIGVILTKLEDRHSTYGYGYGYGYSYGGSEPAAAGG